MTKQSELDEILIELINRIELCAGVPGSVSIGREREYAAYTEAKLAILGWHNKQVKNAVATAEDNLDQYWNKELNKQVEAVLDRLEAQFVEEVVVIFGETKVKKQVPLSAIEAERNKLEAEL